MTPHDSSRLFMTSQFSVLNVSQSECSVVVSPSKQRESMSLRGVASTKPELEKNKDNPREFISLGVHDPELSLRTVSRRNVKNDIQSGVPRCAGRYKIAGGKLLTVHEQLMHSAGFRGLIWHPK